MCKVPRSLFSFLHSDGQQKHTKSYHMALFSYLCHSLLLARNAYDKKVAYHMTLYVSMHPFVNSVVLQGPNAAAV